MSASTIGLDDLQSPNFAVNSLSVNKRAVVFLCASRPAPPLRASRFIASPATSGIGSQVRRRGQTFSATGADPNRITPRFTLF